MASERSVARLYDRLTPQERLVATLEAMARDDEAEVHRLKETCPKHLYREADDAFVRRYESSREIALAVYVDLVSAVGRIRMLDALAGYARDVGKRIDILVGLAFSMGEAHGWALASGEVPSADDDAQEEMEDDDEDEVDDDSEDGIDDGDNAVEDVAPVERPAEEDEADRAMRPILKIGGYVQRDLTAACVQISFDSAGELISMWTALQRWCRQDLGIEPEPLLNAWGAKTDEIRAFLDRNAGAIQPDEAFAKKLTTDLHEAWVKRTE